MDLASHYIEYIEKLCLVGDFGGQPFILREWQKQIIRELFRTKDGRRIVSKFFLLLPRKNAKSTLIAAILLVMLLSGERNQQILSAASCETQAAVIFNIMKEMIESDPELMEMTEIVASTFRITVPSTNSFYVAVSSGGESLHGLSPTVVVMDELHAWSKKRHRDLFAALTTGSGARKNPLTIIISTQTAEVNSIAYDQFAQALKLRNRFENGKKVKTGTADRPEHLAVLYYADQDKHDWTDRAVHQMVNPAWGDFLNTSDFEDQFQTALQMPSQQQTFKQFRLNMLGVSTQKWIDPSLWKKRQGELPSDEELTEHPCFGSLDLAPVRDLSAFCLIWPIDGKLFVRSWAWCNAADILHRSKVEGVPYDIWADPKQGKWIWTTEGDTTDFDQIREDINTICSPYRVQKIGADAAHAYQLAQQLTKDGFEIEWVKPYYQSISPGMQRLEKMIIDGSIVHDGNPVLAYCMSNVIAQHDGQGLIRPANKPIRRDQDKIDSAVALILGMNTWMRCGDDGESVYETGASLFL